MWSGWQRTYFIYYAFKNIQGKEERKEGYIRQSVSDVLWNGFSLNAIEDAKKKQKHIFVEFIFLFLVSRQCVYRAYFFSLFNIASRFVFIYKTAEWTKKKAR